MLGTGCRVTHEDLKDNIVDTYDATKANKSNDLPGDVTDVTGHGTHVAGIAPARADKGKGVARTSYNAGLSIVKVFPSYDVRDEATGVHKRVSGCYTDDMDIGYKHVLETRSAHNIRVVNMSIQGSRGDDGFSDGDELLNDQVKAAYDAGIVTVCSAGNTNGNEKEDGSSSLPYRSFPVDLDSVVVGVMNLLGPNELSGDSNYNTDGQE